VAAACQPQDTRPVRSDERSRALTADNPANADGEVSMTILLIVGDQDRSRDFYHLTWRQSERKVGLLPHLAQNAL
jgi:hypothetical protein